MPFSYVKNYVFDIIRGFCDTYRTFISKCEIKIDLDRNILP